MRHRRSHKRRGSATIGGIGSIISKAAPYVAFIQQLTEKDIAVLPAGRTYQQQGKDLVNIITGRMGGFHLFNSASDYKPPFTINPGAILTSRWVQAGAGMIAYSLVAKKVKFLPKGAKIGSIGKKIAFGGGVGALFDAPNGTMSQGSTYTAPAPAGSGMTQINNTVPTYQSSTYMNSGMGGIS